MKTPALSLRTILSLVLVAGLQLVCLDGVVPHADAYEAPPGSTVPHGDPAEPSQHGSNTGRVPVGHLACDDGPAWTPGGSSPRVVLDMILAVPGLGQGIAGLAPGPLASGSLPPASPLLAVLLTVVLRV